MAVEPYALSVASLTALTEAASAISSTLDLKSVLETISRLACAVTRAEASSVFLLDNRQGKLTVAAASGQRRDLVLGQEFDHHLGIPGMVVRQGEPANIINARQHARFAKEIDDLGSLKTRSILAAPMIHHGNVIGVIEVVNRLDQSDFTEHDTKLLQVFASLAASGTQNARTHEDLRRRYEGLRESVMKEATIIGESPQIAELLGLCDRVAPSHATVLILGETGTGKELCARYIHNTSKRQHETFVPVNCAAVTETLLESELFGHEKGAFTGAHACRRGWFELADGGTLFLDEIGEVSRSVQAKLLRVLQEKEFMRVGGTKPISCDVRIIAATNRKLKNMMHDGVFREDLYYRLSVFPIEVPPLRERQQDIPLLARYFVERSVKQFGIPELNITREALDVLSRYSWPGNIRELQNVVERSVLMSDGQRLQARHLPPDLQESAQETPDGTAENSPLIAQERSLIHKALQENGWNQSQTARALGISRDYLRHRIKKYGLHKDAAPPPAP